MALKPRHANPVVRGLGPGLRYGALAFAAGALLGPVREWLLAPALGGLPAALLEAAALGVLLWLAAGVAARGLPARPWQGRATMALMALLIVLLADAVLAQVLAGVARTPRGEAEQAVGQALLAWLVAVPLLVRRRG